MLFYPLLPNHPLNHSHNGINHQHEQTRQSINPRVSPPPSNELTFSVLPRLTFTRFFNNSTLSDVIIKQIYKGETREYFAHKAVLCMNSRYFLRAFTGNFKVGNAN